MLETMKMNMSPSETVAFMRRFGLETLLADGVERMKEIDLFEMMTFSEATIVAEEFQFVHGNEEKKATLGWWLQDPELTYQARDAFDRMFFGGPVKEISFVQVMNKEKKVDGYVLVIHR